MGLVTPTWKNHQPVTTRRNASQYAPSGLENSNASVSGFAAS
jgi:hypothetical protein